MTPARNPSWFRWLRVAAPAAFVGYGLYLVAHSVLIGVAVGAGVMVLCLFLLGLVPRRPDGDERRDAGSD